MNSIFHERPSVLITGATGFIGSFLVEEALAKDMNVIAAVRHKSNLQYLKSPKIHFAEFDYSSTQNISKSLHEIITKVGKIDYVIHSAGITKTNKVLNYYEVNCNYTRNLLTALAQTSIPPSKFIFISSLAVYGPGNPRTFQPIKESDTPSPISNYGKSKLLAEQQVIAQQHIPWLIIRPTAVFGPREKEIFSIFKLISHNVNPWVANKEQRLSFIYVKDLVRAILTATISSHSKKAYFVSDGESYRSHTFGEYVKKHLKKRAVDIPISKKALKFTARNLEILYGLSGKTPGLNTEKAIEMSSSNWLCDVSPIISDLNFKPEYTLENGIKETLNWYKSAGWL